MPRIMVDPGHGGKDSGAVNTKKRLNEKDINLDVGLYLGKYLRDKLGQVSTLTRAFDEFVPLRTRCTLANEWNADYFISLHTNARPRKGKYGIEFETYYCAGSEKGEELADAIQKKLLLLVEPSIVVHDRGIKKGRYYVLRHTKMPAVLVEMGFLSDNEEAEWLRQVTSQKLLAEAIAEGFFSFIHPI